MKVEIDVDEDSVEDNYRVSPIHTSEPPVKPVPVSMVTVGSRQQSEPSVTTPNTCLVKQTMDYETFLRDIAYKEHEQKMEIYRLKKEVLFMKKRKLDAELNNQMDMSYLQECVQKKGKFEQILDKT